MSVVFWVSDSEGGACTNTTYCFTRPTHVTHVQQTCSYLLPPAPAATALVVVVVVTGRPQGDEGRGRCAVWVGARGLFFVVIFIKMKEKGVCVFSNCVVSEKGEEATTSNQTDRPAT